MQGKSSLPSLRMAGICHPYVACICCLQNIMCKKYLLCMDLQAMLAEYCCMLALLAILKRAQACN